MKITAKISRNNQNSKWSHTIILRSCLFEKHQVEWSNKVSDKGAALDNCVGFIDGTCRQICRPSVHQRSFYNGHKHYHCLKYQSITVPCGIIIDLSGPHIGIRHDLRMLNESNLLQRFMNISSSYVIYGDPAFGLDRNMCCPFEGNIN